jgi:hypothetical protein
MNMFDAPSRFDGIAGRVILLVFFLVVQILAVLPDSVLGRTQTFTGKAFNGGGQLEYLEEHNIIYEGEKVTRSRTTYLGLDEQVIGSLTSEYAPTPRFCNYTFRDLRRQYVDGARIKTDQICLFRKKGPEGEEETVCLPMDDKQITGQGFHHFIVNQLDAIAAGEVFHVKLAFPSRLDQFGFRIRKKSIEGKNLFIRLEIDNWFLRLFTPHVDVVYERGSGRLLRYEGISNVADASGQFKKVQIKYFY